MIHTDPQVVLFRLVSTKLLEGEFTLVLTPSIKMMDCTAVPREYQLTFGCTRLQELEYFCMLQSTQQFFCFFSFLFSLAWNTCSLGHCFVQILLPVLVFLVYMLPQDLFHCLQCPLQQHRFLVSPSGLITVVGKEKHTHF